MSLAADMDFGGLCLRVVARVEEIVETIKVGMGTQIENGGSDVFCYCWKCSYKKK
jgi:hypothetical protein